MEKGPPEQPKMVGKITEIQPLRPPSDTVGEVMEISHDELPPMPEKSAFMFHHNFLSKTKSRPRRC